MQMSNDIFDVYEDSRAGVQTIMTHSQQVASVRVIFKDWLNRAYAAMYKTHYPPKK
jgi:hypothetical protein